jgi:hypothetical protein
MVCLTANFIEIGAFWLHRYTMGDVNGRLGMIPALRTKAVSYKGPLATELQPE